MLDRDKIVAIVALTMRCRGCKPGGVGHMHSWAGLVASDDQAEAVLQESDDFYGTHPRGIAHVAVAIEWLSLGGITTAR